MLTVHKKYDAVYKGVLNLVNYVSGGYLNLEKRNPVSVASNLEDHHISPNDYLKKNWANVHESLDSEIAIDCVVNRTLIPKLSNIKVSNKPSSKYLAEIRNKNHDIAKALRSHLMDVELITGDYDAMYDYFLSERAGAIFSAMDENVTAMRTSILKQFGMS